MKREMKIQAGPVRAEAELNDTETAKAVWNALPIRANASTWGEEIFFEIPVRHPQELGQETVQAGDLGYWPPGRAFCVFFGPTPASRGDEIRPASPVTVIGHLRGDPKAFRHVRDLSEGTAGITTGALNCPRKFPEKTGGCACAYYGLFPLCRYW